MNPRPMTQQERERELYLYSVALEQEDFETIEKVLQVAQNDAAFERMLMEVNEVYQAEYEQTAHEEAATLVRQLLREHLLSALPVDEEELPPLTVGDVIAKMQVEAAQRGKARKETLAVASRLQHSPTPVPFPLRLPEVRRLFKQLGVSTSLQFEKLFQDTATFLAMGRGQSLMAATRRQKKTSRTKPQEPKP